MSGIMIIVFIVLGGVILLFLAGVSIYNSLVTKKNLMEEGWSSIDVFLKKRNDLIPNLMETVKGYASHEKELFENVTASRNLVQNANNVSDQGNAENALKNSMMNLFAIAENYPELKANQNFIEMQNELSAIEEEIEMARRYYNGTVKENNIAIESFPSNIISNMFNFDKGTFFEIKETSQREPTKVSF
ncbi:LemA protein [Aquimarina sp. MAR_2010_214]|uniref:LemA family protein n=1 Tax=Aquimarina sp. MAR_2010_214 TaxID=1250026 RepID=UPI000CB851D9|nr:LemA family protein [Aquimarina sp. MAR_2010_214]PKV52994.1 LemA protein [Aquimarina sp. MAR_2010_214]